jgi:hypothetical protein
MSKLIELSGKVFGLLRVVDKSETPSRRPRWKCVCVCGNTHVAEGSELRRGRVRSCGCATNLLIGVANTKHGMSRSRAYKAWAAMKNRCLDVNRKDYGGRGITVCKRWLVFDNFYVDMGDPPAGHTLERKNNMRGYSKANCVWATPREQNINRRNSLNITFCGVTDTLAAHARRAGLKYDTVHHRIFQRGWPVDKALTTKPFGTRVDVPL